MRGTVIIVNDVAHVNGGVAQVAILDANGLVALGYKVIFFTATPPVEGRIELSSAVELVCTNQFEIVLDPNRIRAMAQGIWNFKAANVIDDVLRKCSKANTIVHLHGWTKALSSSVGRVAITKGFTLVCTLYEYFLACPNGGFYNFPGNHICKLRPLSRDCVLENCDSRNYGHKLWRVARQVVQRNIGLIPQGIRHFIACSELSLTVLRPYLPADCRIHRVPNPINVTRQEMVDVGNNHAFTFVGRLSSEKGASLFAKAARRLGCRATFVGDGSCSTEIRSIYPDARITGWVASHQVQEFLKCARVLVFPSLWCEVQGLVVLEAAALGIPAIVPDTAATREMVINGVTGLWFNGGDEDDLLDKLTTLQDPDTARKYGRAAYDTYWEDPPTAQARIERLDACYQDILHTEEVANQNSARR